MQDISILLLISSILAGYLLGVISGLTPGIHTNNFALLLAASAPFLDGFGIGSIYIVVIILTNSITHTFLDIIPSIFLGAPEPDTALAVLPGHHLMLEGRGEEAIRLSAFGSASSIILSLIFLVPLFFLFKHFYALIYDQMGLILITIVLIMILTERGVTVEGQGSLAVWRYRTYAIAVFALSGILGILAFEREPLIDPILGWMETSVLFPLFSGLFGASMLVISILTHTTIPPQKRGGFNLPGWRILRGVTGGSLAGSIVAFLPGISSAIATLLSRILIKEDQRAGSNEEFILSISGVNTANALFALIALYTINRPRSGAMVAIEGVVDPSLWTVDTINLFLIIILLVSLLSYITTIQLGRLVPKLIQKINYLHISLSILILLALLVILSSGTFGLILFLTAITIGMIPTFAGVRRIHAMGVLLLPLILYFIGF
ncbi:MAG: tripartite tricarboxylate transporter permease [Candidatus Syntropharchaeales archaeon]